MEAIRVIWIISLICGLIIAGVYLFNLDELLSQGSDLDLENFSIEALTDEQIINEVKSHEEKSSVEYTNNTGSGASNIAQLDSDRIQYSCEKVTGIARVSVTKAKDCTLTLNISSTLESGNAKIVVVRDDMILDYVEFGESKELTYSVTGEHIFTVKLLCEEAKLSVEVIRAFD